MQFRKDINGLRAIAVIAVVLFHFNASWMPGGFAGVDVFFVISGFLMTGIIFRGIEQENFSILKFYVARANRIIPALAVLCLVLLIFGWFYLAPLDYRALGKHAASSMGFLSNIIYLRESGYFDAASHEKWLLHTWSLSAEWQFYIIYPVVLVAMQKFMSVKAMKATILIGAVLGFIFCVIVTYIKPNPAYYLLPARAWEMMIGGVAYLFPFAVQDKRKRLLEWFGAALIIGSYFLISKDSPWPGYLALFPVLGSFLIIQAQRNDSFLTSNIVSQKIGAWSYSIYLWHWPLVVAIYYFSLNETYIYLGITLSLLLGFLSNNYIEKIKFRNDFGKLFSYLKCGPVYIVLVVGIIGSVVFINKGFENRNPEVALAGAAEMPEYYQYCFGNVRGKISDEYCVLHSDGTYDRNITSNIDVIVLGDSHASVIVNSLLESMKNNNKVGDLLFYGHPGCLPLADRIDDIYMTEFTESCSYRNRGIIDLINKVKNEKTKIVMANRLPMFLYGMNETINDKPLQHLHFMTSNKDININKKLVMKSYIKLIDELKNISDTYILLPIPEQKLHIPRTISRSIMQYGYNSYKGITVASYLDRNEMIIKELHEVDGIQLIDPTIKLCDEFTCNALHDKKSLYFDEDHLSIYGAKYISELFDIMWN